MKLIEFPIEMLDIIFAELDLWELLALKQLNSTYYQLIKYGPFFWKYINAIDPVFRPYSEPEKNLRELTMLRRLKEEWGLSISLYDIYCLERIDIGDETNLYFLSALKNLKKIHIGKRTHLDIDFLGNLPNLETIVLEESIPLGRFEDLEKCKGLKVKILFNKEAPCERALKMRSIYELSNVKSLYYCHSRGSAPISNRIARMQGLRKLVISGQETNSLPCSLGKLFLRELHINKCKMDRIPEEVFSMHTLEEIHLIETNLFELPEKISGLTRLRVLKIISARIVEIPYDIGFLANLERIILEKTNIGRLPLSISNLTNLRCLGLKENYLVWLLPHDMSKMINLECLQIQNTKVRWLPVDELKKLPCLEIFAEGTHIININEARKSIKIHS